MDNNVPNKKGLISSIKKKYKGTKKSASSAGRNLKQGVKAAFKTSTDGLFETCMQNVERLYDKGKEEKAAFEEQKCIRQTQKNQEFFETNVFKEEGAEILKTMDPRNYLKGFKNSSIIIKGFAFILDLLGYKTKTSDTHSNYNFGIKNEEGKRDWKKFGTMIMAGFFVICMFPAIPMFFVMYILYQLIYGLSFATKML